MIAGSNFQLDNLPDYNRCAVGKELARRPWELILLELSVTEHHQPCLQIDRDTLPDSFSLARIAC